MNHFTTKTRLVRAAMTLLVALLGSVTGAWAQETLTVYDGTDYDNRIPMYGADFDYYTKSECIFPATDLTVMEGGTITAITFYVKMVGTNNTVWTNTNQKVFLKEVSGTTLGGSFSGMTGATVVFDGLLPMPSTGGYTITFPQDYTYNGGNLLIGVYNDDNGSYNFVHWYGTSGLTSGVSAYGSNYSSLANCSYNALSFLPKTTFTYTPAGSFKRPTGLIVSNLTSNGATISWTAPEGSPTPTRYAYQYKKATDEEWSTEATTTYTSVSISGLAPATAYDFQVKAVYGTDGESSFASKNFTTSCGVYGIPYTYGFEEAEPFDCWTPITGVDRDNTPGQAHNGTYYLKLTGRTNNNLVVLPQFNAPTSTLRVECYICPSNPGSNSGKLAIGYMTDTNDASTFVAVATYNSTEMTTTYVKKKVDFAKAPADAIIAMRQFDCSGSSWYVDDVTVKAIPSCLEPTGLTAFNVTASTATLRWASNASEWVVAYKAAADEDFTEVPAVAEKSYTLTGLTPETTYTVKVRTNCGGGEYSEWSDPVSFEATDKLAIGSGIGTSDYLPSNTYYNYSYTQQIYTVEELGEAGVIESIDFYMTGNDYTRNLDIYMVSTDKDNFASTTDWIAVTADDCVFSGEVTFGGGEWTTITLDNAFIYDGTKNVAIIVDDNTHAYSSRSFRTFTATANQALYKYQDGSDIPIDYSSSGTRTTSKNQIRILKSAMGDCMKPTQLTATEVGPDFAKLSWTENGNATEWVIVYNDNTITANTNDNFILEGLDNETEYTVYVYPACDANQRSKTITFTTLVSNPVPSDVAATKVKHNSAKVIWIGYSDSYSVKLGEVIDNIVLDEDFDSNDVPAGWSNDNTYPWTCATHGDGYCLQSGNAGQSSTTSSISVTATYTTDGTISFDFWARGEGSDTNDWDNCRFYIDGVQMFRYSTRNDWESYSTEVVAGTHTFKWEFKKDGSVDGTGDYFAIDNVVMSSSSINWRTPVSTTEKAYTFNDLTANTKYYIQVQGKKGDSTSEWSEVVGFTTMPEPDDIELANNATNNASTIEEKDGVYANVTLSGRELYKDSYWNTLCLPFDIELDGSPLDGAEARELSSANISGTTLNLNFSEPVDELTAGTPYIIKWSSGTTLTGTELVFDGVMVYDTYNAYDNREDGDARVRFIGTYNAITFNYPNFTEDKSILFLGGNNALYYPQVGVDEQSGETVYPFIGACRAYFKIGEDGGSAARLLTGFNLNFGDETNAVFDLNNKEEIRNNSWYSLDGVKLDGKPTKKGLYIRNGRKVVIK